MISYTRLSIVYVCQFSTNIRAGPSQKGAYGFSNVMQANDVDDVIYDVTMENAKHAAKMFQKNLNYFLRC